jgi:hypothetical protein
MSYDDLRRAVKREIAQQTIFCIGDSASEVNNDQAIWVRRKDANIILYGRSKSLWTSGLPGLRRKAVRLREIHSSFGRAYPEGTSFPEAIHVYCLQDAQAIRTRWNQRRSR